MGQVKHNGWTNYETWAVNAHLMNNEPLYERLMSIIQNPDDGYQQAETLQEWLRIDRDAQPEDIALEGELVGMYIDLVCAALDAVNWREIVEHAWQDVNQFNGYKLA